MTPFSSQLERPGGCVEMTISSAPNVLQRVVHRLHRVGVADLPARLDPRRGERREGLPEPALGLRPGAVLVGGPVAELRVEGGADDEHVGVRSGTPDDLAAERAARDRLVGDDEDAAAPLALRVSAPARPAARARP